MDRIKMNNIRPLSKDELAFFLNRYSIELKEPYIIVTARTDKNGVRRTIHDMNKQFALSTSFRRITITKMAIEQWVNNFMDKYSLIEVQNAIAILFTTYREINTKNIELAINENK